MVRNKILKILFIFAACWFLISLLLLPKTDCEACAIEYEGDVIKGVEAFQVFEDGCISYNKPWNNEIDINITMASGKAQLT